MGAGRFFRSVRADCDDPLLVQKSTAPRLAGVQDYDDDRCSQARCISPLQRFLCLTGYWRITVTSNLCTPCEAGSLTVTPCEVGEHSNL